MVKIWKVSRLAKFQDCGDNMFTVTFATHADRQKVMARRPWSFDNNLFALKVINAFTPPSKIQFDSEVF